jgi:hypothetical protein
MHPYAHVRSLPPKGAGFASPSGNYGAPPPFPRARAGVAGHLPRLAGKDGKECCRYPAHARAALREA